jgi:hypothetical protein
MIATLLPLRATAAQINLPLDLDYMLLDSALRARFYAGPEGRADFFTGNDACQYLYGRNPRFSRDGSQVRLETNAELSLGLAMGDRCMSPVQWSGIIEAATAPYIAGAALKFRVTDVNLYNPDHSVNPLAGQGLDLIKGSLIPRLETFSYDIASPMSQLNQMIASAVPAREAGAEGGVTLSLGPDVVAQDDGVQLRLAIAMPDALAARLTAPAPKLSTSQAASWRAALHNADHFIAGASSQMQGLAVDPETRTQLGAVIDDSRRRLQQAEADPPAGGDPLPLFRADWNQLRMIVAGAAHRGALGNNTLEALSLISIGDLIFALDERAPGLGAAIAAEGLNQFARTSN